MTSEPLLFSIIIPTYNRAHLISTAINSVLSQQFKSFELIIVDDGSTDNTNEIISSFKDKRIRYFFKQNEERGAARNFGVAQAIGRYVSFFDSDDILYEQYLQTAFEAIQKLNDPEVFHLDYEFIDDKGVRFSRGGPLPDFLNEHLLINSCIGVVGVFIRRDIALTHKFITHRRAIVAEDLYLWLTLASRYNFYHLPTVTSAIVVHPDRSLNNKSPYKFLMSTLLIVRSLSDDEKFIKYYSKQRVDYFFAKNFVQVALVFAEGGRLAWAIKLLRKGFIYSWKILFNRTFLATIKVCVMKFLRLAK
jgi:glycosyltransferase involved in cell wall biosynthesis